MKFSELATHGVEALQAMLREERQRLEQLRFQVHEGTSKDVREMRQAKLQIARILTALGHGGPAKKAKPASGKDTVAAASIPRQSSGGKK